MRAGKLRTRLALEAATETQDTFGEPDKAWAEEAKVWAEVQNLDGTEGYDAGAQVTRGERLVRISIRYRAGVTTEKRFTRGTTVYNIQSIANAGERDRELQITARVRG